MKRHTFFKALTKELIASFAKKKKMLTRKCYLQEVQTRVSKTTWEKWRP